MMTTQGRNQRTVAWNERLVQEEYEEFEMHGFNDEPTACFSSFVPSPFLLDGLEWPSANHYFQAQKFVDEDYKEAIRSQPDSFSASTLGKNRGKPIQQDWDQKRYAVMEKAVEAKFSQNADMRAVLLATSKAILCHNPEDGFWGDGIGCGGSHLNSMGKILMATREKLAEK
jgi:ribA/ribD-fused uncharacterized protein